MGGRSVPMSIFESAVPVRFAPPRTVWRRRSRPALGALALVVGLVLIADGWAVTQSGKAHPVSLHSALQRFRAEEQTTALAPGSTSRPTSVTGGGSTAAVPAGSTSGTLAPTASGPTPSVTTPVTVRPATPAGTAPPATPTTAPPAATPFTLPPAGVYSYRTSGGEQLNVPGSARSYPSVTYATVTHEGGCNWEIENDVIQQHTDHRLVCSEPGELLQLNQGRTISFFGDSEGFTYVCSPPFPMILRTDRPGTTRTGTCSDGKGDGATLTETWLGTQQVTVGGQTVTIVHAVFDGVLSGAATGTSTDDIMFDATTGMIVSWVRSVDTNASGAFGVQAHYTEHASFALLSLEPQT